MRKQLLVLLALLVATVCVLAACGGETATNETDASVSEGTDADESAPDAQESAASAPETSDGTPNGESTDSDVPLTETDGAVTVVYASYSERPYAAIVGTCDEGATVCAESKNGTVETASWHGWFSIRVKCSVPGTMFTFTQKVNGETVGEPTVKKISPTTPSSDMWPIITGYDSQLFFQKMLPDYKHNNLPDSSRLSSFRSRVSDRVSRLKSVNPNAEIIYMVVPSSMTVYPELVPDSYAAGSGKSRMDLVLDAAKEGGAAVIDLRETFAQHKNDEMPLYYKFDSHWTDYGAYLAYTELFTHIAERFPAAQPRAMEEFDWVGSSYESGDMIYYLQMSREVVKDYGYLRVPQFSDESGASRVQRYVSRDRLTYHDEVTWEYAFDSHDASKPNLLILRDSYSTQIFDILAERANRTHYLGMWNYAWDFSSISQEKPDYIIYIIAEWNIDSILYA